MVCSAVVTWIVSPSDTLVTVPVTVRIRAAWDDDTIRDGVNPVNENRMRIAQMKGGFRRIE